MDIPILGLGWRPGDRVDFVPRPGRDHGPGGQQGTYGLPKDHALSAFDKAIQEGQGVRKRAIVDRIITNKDGSKSIRLILDDGHDFVWASPDEVDTLDPISALGDIVGRTDIRDVLARMEEEEEKPICIACNKPITGLVHWRGKESSCDPCRNAALGLA